MIHAVFFDIVILSISSIQAVIDKESISRINLLDNTKDPSHEFVFTFNLCSRVVNVHAMKATQNPKIG